MPTKTAAECDCCQNPLRPRPEPTDRITLVPPDSSTRTLPHQTGAAQPAPDVETVNSLGPSTSVSGLRIACPDCRHPFEIPVDAELAKVRCPACGESFSLVHERMENERAEAISKIAHFELLERVGMGGFGTVWKARDTQLNRLVALKIPRQGQLAPDVLAELMHEARTAAQLKHSHIVQVYQIGQDGDTVYFVSEFMAGKSLDKWMFERRLTHAEIARLCVKIAQALHYAHQAGVVHRDLKPQNVLMDAQGEPHITDFGLSKHDAGDVAITDEGRILGTPAYMSPEQASGRAATADGRTDVYSFGAMLFQLLTDTLPFQGSVHVLIHKAITEDPPSPRSLDAAIPQDLETICLKCLEKDPVSRYQSADEVVAELKRFLAGEPVLARPVSRTERLWRWCKRHPVFPSLLATLVAVLLVVYPVGWILFETAYRQSERAFTAQSLRGVGFAAESVAHTASREIEDHFALVELLSHDERLRASLHQWAHDAELAKLREILNTSDLSEAERAERRKQLMEHPAFAPLQGVLQQMTDKAPDAFGWFVLEAEGLQVARWPANETIGVNYCWRTYYHGGSADFADRKAYLASDRRRLDETHLSAAFVSQVTDQWVLVISTPVWDTAQDGQSHGTFLGVVAFMFELGHITGLPREPDSSIFTALIDTRPGREGTILQHPLYESVLASSSQRLPDRFQSYRVESAGWKDTVNPKVRIHANYRDPFASDEMGKAFAQRWLAGRSPIHVRGQDSGLEIIVQESYQQAVGGELARLRQKIEWLVGITGAAFLALIIPLSALVVRNVK